MAPLSMSQQPSPPGWDLGIDYPQEDEDEPFKLNNGGSVIVSFFVSNDELLPITIDFTYEVPFEGEFDGPESETPPGHWYVILNYVSDHPKIIKKFVYSTLITSIIFIIIFLLVKYEYLNIRNLIS